MDDLLQLCAVWTVNDALERIDIPRIEIDIYSGDIILGFAIKDLWGPLHKFIKYCRIVKTGRK